MNLNPQDLLITVYLNVCSYFSQYVKKDTLRLSPNRNPVFTDEEVITIYIFGTLSQKRNNKNIHHFIFYYWKEWFPKLPNYSTFNHRLNFLMPLFVNFCDYYVENFLTKKHHKDNIILIDSLPIMMAKGARALKAKVAKDTASFGYCASKKIYYWGVKFHLFADYVANALPNPRLLNITGANEHDLTAVKSLWHDFPNSNIIGDKAYIDSESKESLAKKNINLYTPCKLTTTKKELTEEESAYSKIINSFRQSIEIFFNWIIEMTGIQIASKVRSERGLGVHVFGRFAAAMVARYIR